MFSVKICHPFTVYKSPQLLPEAQYKPLVNISKIESFVQKKVGRVLSNKPSYFNALDYRQGKKKRLPLIQRGLSFVHSEHLLIFFFLCFHKNLHVYTSLNSLTFCHQKCGIQFTKR